MIELIIVIALVYFFLGVVGDFEFKQVLGSIVVILIIGAIFAFGLGGGSNSHEYSETNCGRGCSY